MAKDMRLSGRPAEGVCVLFVFFSFLCYQYDWWNIPFQSFYSPNNTTVCTSTSIHFRRAGHQGPTRTLTGALKHSIKQLMGTYSTRQIKYYNQTRKLEKSTFSMLFLKTVKDVCIPPGSLNRVPASAGVKAGMSPLSPCDPTWHVCSRSGVVLLTIKV